MAKLNVSAQATTQTEIFLKISNSHLNTLAISVPTRSGTGLERDLVSRRGETN